MTTCTSFHLEMGTGLQSRLGLLLLLLLLQLLNQQPYDTLEHPMDELMLMLLLLLLLLNLLKMMLLLLPLLLQMLQLLNQHIYKISAVIMILASLLQSVSTTRRMR